MNAVDVQPLIVLGDHSITAASMAAAAKEPIASLGLLKFIVINDIPAQALNSLHHYGLAVRPFHLCQPFQFAGFIVKTTNGAHTSAFIISLNEFDFLQETGDAFQDRKIVV